MTMKLLEGFDMVSSTALLTSKGWTSTASGGGSVAITGGRISGNSYQFTTGSGDSPLGSAIKSLPAAYTQFACGFAFMLNFSPTAPTDLLVMRQSTNPAFRIGMVNATNLLIVRNQGGTTVASGTTALVPGVWYYVEAQGVINGASGSVTLHLNGAAEIATTT